MPEQSDPEIERIEPTPERVKWAADLAVHACFEAQMGQGLEGSPFAGPFTITRRGKEIVCYRFVPMDQTVLIYAAPMPRGKRPVDAWPLSRSEMDALAQHTKWAPFPE